METILQMLECYNKGPRHEFPLKNVAVVFIRSSSVLRAYSGSCCWTRRTRKEETRWSGILFSHVDTQTCLQRGNSECTSDVIKALNEAALYWIHFLAWPRITPQEQTLSMTRQPTVSYVSEPGYLVLAIWIPPMNTLGTSLREREKEGGGGGETCVRGKEGELLKTFKSLLILLKL